MASSACIPGTAGHTSLLIHSCRRRTSESRPQPANKPSIPGRPATALLLTCSLGGSYDCRVCPLAWSHGLVWLQHTSLLTEIRSSSACGGQFSTIGTSYCGVVYGLWRVLRSRGRCVVSCADSIQSVYINYCVPLDL